TKYQWVTAQPQMDSRFFGVSLRSLACEAIKFRRFVEKGQHGSVVRGNHLIFYVDEGAASIIAWPAILLPRNK
ncbi:MAG: hypothetical protein OEV91_11305, partial [Desulfobulbaceae bacterium]|nr:hypothetical protein [Desulfobulbaceae bacterium]